MSTKVILLDSTVANASNTADFTVNLTSPIDLENTKWNIALSSLRLYYTWFNISAALGNNVFKYFNGTTNRVLTLEDGTYSFSHLVEHIQDKMITLGDYTPGTPNVFSINFYLDTSDGFVSLSLSNSYTVNFTNMPIRTVFGAGSVVYTTNSVFPNKADIDLSNNAIFLHLDIISGNSYINGSPSDVILSFQVDTSESGLIEITPPVFKYIGISRTDYISTMRLYLTNQSGTPINLNGSPLSAEFVLAMSK